MSDYEYANLRRVRYGDSDSEFGAASFVPVCPQCFRFVKADKSMRFSYDDHPGLNDKPNATCATHGRVQMLFEGYV